MGISEHISGAYFVRILYLVSWPSTLQLGSAANHSPKAATAHSVNPAYRRWLPPPGELEVQSCLSTSIYPEAVNMVVWH